MNKQAKQFLSQTVAPTLLKLSSQRDRYAQEVEDLKSKLSEYKKAEEIEKIARKLEGKGQWIGTSLEDRINFVKESADNGADLEKLSQAADLLGADGNIGTMSEKIASRGDSYTEFVAAIMEG